MLTQIENTDAGYIVGIYVPDGKGAGEWLRLRNFGHRQGDAICFRDYDLPELSDSMIRALAKAFRVENIYERVKKHQYRKTK